MKEKVNTHQKYYNSRGEEVPSVTTVLKLLNNNLDGWANYMGMKGINTKLYVQERAEYGTFIHAICEKFFKGELSTQLSECDIDNSTIGYTQDDFDVLYSKLTIIRDLFAKQGYRYYSSELSISGETYGGTIDLILYNEESNDYIIIDFKTSKSVYSKYYTQLAAYTELLRNKYSFTIKAVCVILIEKQIMDKSFINLRLATDNEYNIRIFTDLLNIYYLMTTQERSYYIGS